MKKKKPFSFLSTYFILFAGVGGGEGGEVSEVDLIFCFEGRNFSKMEILLTWRGPSLEL